MTKGEENIIGCLARARFMLRLAYRSCSADAPYLEEEVGALVVAVDNLLVKVEIERCLVADREALF